MITYMHSKYRDGYITAAIKVYENQAVAVAALAWCSPLDQFSRKKGRLIATGRLHRDKTFCTVNLVPDIRVKAQVRDQLLKTIAVTQHRIPLWAREEQPMSVTEMVIEIERLRTAVGFACSVIKSGEAWGEVCAEMLRTTPPSRRNA